MNVSVERRRRLEGCLLGTAVGDVDSIVGGPFGPRHLRALAQAVDDNAPAPGYVATFALLRNLLLYPVILAHGFRRLLPPW
jgi:ADP-ribosyl-[dinitrogen reductase] hydrolase